MRILPPGDRPHPGGGACGRDAAGGLSAGREGARMTRPLNGRRIAVPETRELDLFAAMLERQGAVAERCPLVSILDVEDPEPVEAWLGRLAAGAHDDLIFLTGEGVARLTPHARRLGIEAEVVAQMKRAR